MANDLLIKSAELADLLPHSGAMCLLEGVLSWGSQSIACLATSHQDLANPLRDHNSLPVVAGIEYAAQAMAIHGTLIERRAGSPRLGYLAVLSKVQWYCQRLDDLPGELLVRAEKQMATAGGSSYTFSLLQRDELLLEGSAVVALQDP